MRIIKNNKVIQIDDNFNYKNRIEELENNVSEYDSRIQQVETNVSEYDSRIESVENTVSGYDSRLESVETNVSEYDSRIEELENKFNTEIGEIHTHTNLDNLNKIGEDSEGNLTYNGNKIEADIPVASSDTVGGIKIGSIFNISDDNTLGLRFGLGLMVNNLGQLIVNGYDYSFDPIKDTQDLPMLKSAVAQYYLTKNSFNDFKTNTIGTSVLSTDDKTLKGAINELFTSVSNGKNLLETAITDKGGTVSKSGDIATFDELKSGILDVPTANCKLNIFTQSTEPIIKQGLWLKTDNIYDKIEDFNNTRFDSFKYTVTRHESWTNYACTQYTKLVKVGKYAYMIGGYSHTSRNLRYDLDTNQTTDMTSIPSDFIPSNYAPNFCCSDNINKIYLIQCGSNNYKSAQYNIDTNTYTALGFSQVTYRNNGESCYYKNKIYCFSNNSDYNYIYDLDTTTVTNMPTSINFNKPNIVLIDDNIYFISEYNSSGNCYKYNLTTGTVTTLATSPLKASTDSFTVYNHGNYIYQCAPSSYIGESPAKLAIVRYDIVNNKHERIMEITTPSSAPAGTNKCGVIYNNKIILFTDYYRYYINFILNKNCLYLDKSDNTNNALLVETPYELLNKKETFKSCFLTNNNSESISCDIYTGNGTSWNKI